MDHNAQIPSQIGYFAVFLLRLHSAAETVPSRCLFHTCQYQCSSNAFENGTDRGIFSFVSVRRHKTTCMKLNICSNPSLPKRNRPNCSLDSWRLHRQYDQWLFFIFRTVNNFGKQCRIQMRKYLLGKYNCLKI